MLVNRHKIVRTETHPEYVNHAGHVVKRYAVVYDNGMRRTYERHGSGGPILVDEDWVEVNTSE